MDRSRLREDHPDASLVAAARQGDVRAFRSLYERHAGRVYRTARRLVDAHAEAEDVVQEVFVRLYRRPEAYDGRAAFTTWLYRVTVNACYDRLRKARRRRQYDGGSLDAEPAPSHAAPAAPAAPAAQGPDAHPAVQLLRTDFERCVERALAALHPELRAALVLKELEGLSYREIALVLRCTAGTVASRLSRARRQVAEALRAVGIDETYFDQTP